MFWRALNSPIEVKSLNWDKHGCRDDPFQNLLSTGIVTETPAGRLGDSTVLLFIYWQGAVEKLYCLSAKLIKSRRKFGTKSNSLLY